MCVDNVCSTLCVLYSILYRTAVECKLCKKEAEQRICVDNIHSTLCVSCIMLYRTVIEKKLCRRKQTVCIYSD